VPISFADSAAETVRGEAATGLSAATKLAGLLKRRAIVGEPVSAVVDLAVGEVVVAGWADAAAAEEEDAAVVEDVAAAKADAAASKESLLWS